MSLLPARGRALLSFITVATLIFIGGGLFAVKMVKNNAQPPLTASQSNVEKLVVSGGLSGVKQETSLPLFTKQDLVSPAKLIVDHQIKAAVGRIAGPTAILTSIEVLKQRFSQSAPTVYLAKTDSPEVVTGASLATDGPLLLTDGFKQDVLLQEITRMKPTKIVVLSGTVGISEAYAKSLIPVSASAAAGATQLVRLAGVDRYASAVGVSVTFTPFANVIAKKTLQTKEIIGGLK